MAIRSRNKVSAEFNMSSMTDIVFLLLIFFLITSTMIHPNALELSLPKSSNQASDKPSTSVSITKDLQFAVERDFVSFEQVEPLLRQKLAGIEAASVALHVDKSVPMEEVVKVMNIAKDNKWRLILATKP
jgi:biopolymer transport protein ExbD